MCLLIVLRGFHPEHPLIVGGNRDERTDRKAAPPGLWVGETARVLSPRDRVAGGTWLAVNEHGLFAGITNWRSGPERPAAPSRGHLVHLAVDCVELQAGLDAVLAVVNSTPHSGFQLVLASADRIVVVRNTAAGVAVSERSEPVVLITNEHGPGELLPRRLAAAAAPRADVGAQLDGLAPLLAERGGDGEHPISKHGDRYATVSSSLLAVPRRDVTELVWRYAPGPPDVTPYRSYGNLGRRLLPE